MSGQLEKCEVLAGLHDGTDAFVIPNPWDIGSAKLLQGLGFKALATTSSGFAFTLGQLDGAVALDEKLSHCTLLASETTVPVSADFEDGYSESAAGLEENLERLIATGVAGCSIEDFSRARKVLLDRNEAIDRLSAAREVIAASGLPFQLTARAENLLRGIDDLDDTIARLKAYAAAGADVLYAPGVRTLENLRLITAELDKPFNVLVPFLPQASVADLAAHGARRISLGGALTWASLKPILDASTEMLEQGTFSFLASAGVGPEVQKYLGRE
jgi:2-methylisocitrate lyase-like PEP mutase family enzyme